MEESKINGEYIRIMERVKADERILNTLSKKEMAIINLATKKEIVKRIMKDYGNFSKYCAEILKSERPLIEKNRVKKLYEILNATKDLEGEGLDGELIKESMRFGNYYHFLLQSVCQLLNFAVLEKNFDKAILYFENFNTALSAKVFHIDDNIKLLLNNTTNKIGIRNMPFPIIYLDVQIEQNNTVFTGILIHKIYDYDKLDPELKSIIFKQEEVEQFDKLKDSTFILLLGYDKIDFGNVFYATRILPDGSFDKIDKHTKNILTFICNFLDYLNDPDVETVNLEEANERHDRELKNYYESCKMDLEHIYITRINRPVKFYPQRGMSEGRSSYHYRFWIRGHFRTLRHKRYGEHIGRKRWIEPFIKGQGILLQKDYKVTEREVRISQN